MILHRRRFLHLAAGSSVAGAAPRFARAQSYPSRPLRLILGFHPVALQTLPRDSQDNGFQSGSGNLS